MLRGVLTVGGWTMASRILGFARDMLIAATLGASPLADAFFVALKLPNLFRRLFGEGAFNAAFVPAFAGTLAVQGPRVAQQLAERMAAIMALWLSLMVVLGILFMPQLMRVLAPGFIGDPMKLGLAVELTRITFPYLLFICLTALVSGVLNGLDRFAAAAAAPIFFNLLSMSALLFLTPFVATPAHALAWGVTLSGVVQLGLVLFAAARAGMALNILRPPSLAPEVREVLRRMIPGVIGASATQLNLVFDIFIASFLPAGSFAYLNYADRVGQLPLGVIGAALGTAMLPLLSRQVRAGESLSAHRTMNRAVELALLLCLPAAIGQAAAAVPIVQVLFVRGAFGAEAAHATAAALAAYAIGLPAYVLVKIFAPGFFARGDTATPVKVGLCAVALNLTLNLLLTPFLLHVGVALATALSAWANALALAWLLRRRGHFLADRRLRRRAPRLLLAALLMGAAILALGALLFPATGLWRYLALALLIGAGAGGYFATGFALGALSWAELKALLRRRRRARAA
ncbi:murein biosynthesis integral membrane protein MurJ [Siccirubricoccus sp. KC 17139]|uniref:Probable lipid II flippase MurJ n=1 Tax=Siccirubricoccus soli TaxID=2899147 RepID=A0ABT1DDC7_9PROT|nr:murein biosynthesis integral membrane protein MurJ [Siccirubricoccus soli]MCO6419936.1 murein biosynthesis integral membrane protein MurJ [Siccirubricoccus soli]MCP2686071.1 murein biosynthesis integral membrane protein MurJ [Siccirubricoccus soli]